MLRALFYAYVFGGLTFIPLLIGVVLFIALYTSVPVGDADVSKKTRGRLGDASAEEEKESESALSATDINDTPRTRKGWLTMRRTFEESAGDGSYVTLVRSFLDSRSKDPKRSRPKDMWYVVLKGKVLYLYEDEEMTECEAAVELSGHQVIIYPEGLPDGELFAKRNAICLRPKVQPSENLPSVTKQMVLEKDDIETKLDATGVSGKKREAQKEALLESEKAKDAARDEALDPSTPWFIFVRSNIEMEDWYFALIHASEQPAQSPTLTPLSAIFEPADMNHLIAVLDEQPDVIPMRWLNALLGRIFFSHYRTQNLEAYIIGRLMKKLAKVKRPAFLTEIAVTQVSVGNKAPMLSKPMLKELTKEGDASIEVHLQYKGEIRITVEATAVINLGARFKSYTVKLALAAVLKELEGNLLVKVKRPPSNRIWYAFTQTPRMVLEVEPIVSDRQITWGMILGTIESKFKEIIQESVVMPNMDDIAFFETGSYEHRGGIWADACRKPNLSTTVSEDSAADDDQSVASAPLPETGPLSPTESTIPSIDEPMRSSSAVEGSSSSTNPDNASDSSRKSRRRSWFTSVRNENSSSSSPDFFTDNTQSSEPEGKRGRSSTDESKDADTPRSQSTPKPEILRTVTPEPFEKQGSEASQSKSFLSTSQSSRRSSSQHSIKVEEETQGEGSKFLRTPSAPNTPGKNSDASQIARSASPPSFFSTLKSKAAAADKQAISNTAKEAIRKWGVNWGGFKKDATSGDESSQTGTSPPSAGSSDANSLFNKARASYAEVRAAVAERKERASHTDDDSDSLQPSSPSTARARVVSNPNPNRTLPNGSVYSETPTNPSIITSAARLVPPKLSSKKSTPSLSRVNTEMDTQDLPVPEEPIKHAPIHVQPQAKTMSIPGIHASHRGDVQSMGYVAPQPPAPSGPSEAMLKNPTIQTVYRLWKNPSQQGQDATDAARAQPESPLTAAQPQPQPGDGSAPSEVPDEDGKDASGSALNSQMATPQPLVKPVPPPLPPRSMATVGRPAERGSVDAPSASETLKSIVQKDETIRSQPTTEPAPAGSEIRAGPEPSAEVAAASDSPQKASADVPTTEPASGDLNSQPPQAQVTAASRPPPPALPPRRIPTPAA